MDILTLFAHPDDETLSAGGTIHRLVSEGNKITIAIPFTGELSRRDSSKDKLKELQMDCRKAMDILGVVEAIIFGRFPDNEGDSFPRLDLFRWVEDTVNHVNPGLILTHHYACTNVDHRRCYEAAVVATRPSTGCHVDIWCGEVPSSTGYLKPTNWEPNIYMGLTSKDVDTKIMALSSYHNEIRPYPHPRSVDIIRAIAQVRGSESGFEYAEAFMAGRILFK